MAPCAKIWKKIKLPVVGYLDESVLEEITIFLLEKVLWGRSKVIKIAWMKEGLVVNDWTIIRVTNSHFTKICCV